MFKETLREIAENLSRRIRSVGERIDEDGGALADRRALEDHLVACVLFEVVKRTEGLDKLAERLPPVAVRGRVCGGA